MGPKRYVMIEDTRWNVSIDQMQIDAIVDHFENQRSGPWMSNHVRDGADRRQSSPSHPMLAPSTRRCVGFVTREWIPGPAWPQSSE